VDFRFRPLRREDFAMLSGWLAQPHVRRWWGDEHDLGSIEAGFGPAVDGRDPTEVFIVEQDGEPIGLIQRYLIDEDPEWKRSLEVADIPAAAAGIDYLIGEERLIGQGIGAGMIGRFVEGTWPRYPGVRAIAVAVQQENRRSWRVLEKTGFQRTWAGTIESDDPNDEGPSYVYVRHRP
jgi:aminoglycoside 6'-N-acetyltransferase